jgi:regulator of protease activity HflC (stomatin/prohibitin superfamily)
VPFAERTRKIKWRSTFPRIVRSAYNSTKQVSEVRQTTTDRIDLRTNVMDFPTQPIITRDNVEIQVHPMILYKLVDPMRVAYETYDLSHAVEKLVQTNLRAIIGDMGMDDTLASREEINRSLKTKIKKICYNWGLEVQGVELLEISPSHEVQTAMRQDRGRRRVAAAEENGRRGPVRVQKGHLKGHAAADGDHRERRERRAEADRRRQQQGAQDCGRRGEKIRRIAHPVHDRGQVH